MCHSLVSSVSQCTHGDRIRFDSLSCQLQGKKILSDGVVVSYVVWSLVVVVFAIR